MTTHDDYIKKLPLARRKKIRARAKELLTEMTLRELRKTQAHSQVSLAEILGMRQGDLSKLEKRTDAYLSTIRRYIEAMGGQLDLIASFPNSKPIKIIHIGDLDDKLLRSHRS